MRYILFFCLLLTTGCASPDISAFRQSSLALTAGLTDNQNNLVEAGKAVSETLANPANLGTQVDDLRKQSKKVNQLAAVLAAYASSVSILSSSGADGTNAVNLLLSNVQTTVTSLSGNSLTIPSEVNSLTSALGTLQQQGANKRLYEIMQAVQGEVDAIAKLISTLPDAEQLIVQGMVTYLRTERQDLINYHAIYQDLHAQLAGIDALTGNALKNTFNACLNAGNCDYAALQKSHENAISSNNNTRTQVQNLMNALMPFEAAYQAWSKDIDNWEASMLKQIRIIPALAAAWQKDHQRIIAYLKRCTELSGIFVSQCEAFSASNLELFGTLLGKAAFAL
jgi:uncharacterized phage infection (PIP) family protein YhgE